MSNSAPGKLTRQQLYDLIRESSKDEYILSEMIRLGYWNEGKEKPSLSTELIAKKGELERELRALLQTQRDYGNPDKVLRDLHDKRKAEALIRREDTKKKNNEARYQRAKQWQEINQKTITFLGNEVSSGLQNNITDTARLNSQSLPVIESSDELANAMGISLSELRFLSYGRKTSKVTHYEQFLIAKKTGGTRRISAPKPRLKRLQYWILVNILEKLDLHDAAHGFVPQRSIVTNAEPHVGADVVVNMDLKNFFPSITYKRIKGLFCHFGYSEHVSTVLALLCSEPEINEVDLDSETFFVARSDRYLPQGAPTSPAISNLLCRKLDRRLIGVSNKMGFTYTRYADDLTYSGSFEAVNSLTKLFWRVEQIVEDEGFVIHPEKTRVMRKNRRQEVTGIVVNNKLSVDRTTLKKFRALLFQIEKDGVSNKTWGKGALIPSIEGYANFVAMVNPGKGITLQKQVAQIKLKYGYQVKPGKVTQLNKRLMRLKSGNGVSPRAQWWGARVASVPELEMTAKQKKEELNQEELSKQTLSDVGKPDFSKAVGGDINRIQTESTNGARKVVSSRIPRRSTPKRTASSQKNPSSSTVLKLIVASVIVLIAFAFVVLF